MRWRIYFVIIFFMSAFILLGLRVYQIQVLKYDYYYAKATSEARLLDSKKNLRGDIYFIDKNWNQIPAAINKDFPSIYAVPKEIKDASGAAEKLSAALAIQYDALLKKLTKPNDLYELLVPKAKIEQAEAVKKLGLKGVYVDLETFRYYPFEDLASQALGFVGINNKSDNYIGLYGVESNFEDILKDGKNINLTIDRNIQFWAESILENTIEKNGAISGSALVQEPKTGKILALANYPNFNPNEYQKSDIKNFLNPAVQLIYEPGSVVKAVTMASALDANKITPDSTFFDTGSVTLNKKTIKNFKDKVFGKVNMWQVIEQSINTGIVFVEQKLGKELFYDYLVRFGFGKKTGIDLPGEASGSLASLKVNSREINFATAAFGQGISATPLQMINAFSAIANRGILMRPYINGNGRPQIVGRVVGQKAADEVIKMMISAVEKAGVTKIDKYLIAGKTGTAQIPDFKNGGYKDEYIHNYIGFAPADDPKFTILIKIDKPQQESAAQTVVPAFKEFVQILFNYYNILPSEIIETKQGAE